ncbi:urease subunit beta (plasmid) [Natrinema zhouii]|uniref:urease subunit beta n=1 Tax=Natrinema zhouii TaxID=1710539 RepID=UPI001CFFA071|nr:urease subunit beta [Natrinema zhouii]UHQ98049.1 urease subunit beta [Natrinema zhouii]
MTNDTVVPGEILPGDEPVTINDGREAVTVTVANTGDRPIQVGSHFHFFEVNRALEFDRSAAFGKRLDILAGTAIRFEPGERAEVDLIDIAGKRRVQGMNNLVNGSVDNDPETALIEARQAGFRFADDAESPVMDETSETSEEEET